MFKATNKNSKASQRASGPTGTDPILSIPERWLPRGNSEEEQQARAKKIQQFNMNAEFILELRDVLLKMQVQKHKQVVSPKRFSLFSPKESLDHLLGQQYNIEEILDLLPKKHK